MFVISGRLPRSSVPRASTLLLSLSWSIAAAGLAVADEPLELTQAERIALEAEPGQQALAARADALAHRAEVAAALPQPEPF